MRQVVFSIPIRVFDWLPNWLPDSIPIYGYGLMLFVAFVICTWLAGRRAQKEGIGREHIQDLAIWLFIGGLVGSRVLFMFYNAPPGGWTLGEFIKQFPQLWDGGVILYGAVIGGVIGYAFAYQFIIRKHGLSGWKIADITAPVIALGIGLGRLGCLLNGCCYGHVACPHCPGISFPLAAPARFELVAKGYQTAAGFTTASAEDDPRTVVSIEPGSATARSGLRPGDVIVQADAQPIKQMDDLREYLRKQATGKEPVVLKVERDGRAVSLEPNPNLLLADFQTLDLRVVRAVEPGSPAARAGLEEWDRIIKADNHDVDDYYDLARYLGDPHHWPRGQNGLTLTVVKPDSSERVLSFVPWTLPLHPTQLYETVSMVLLFLLLLAYYPFRRHDGEVIALLMACYAVHRSLNELLRSDKRPGEFEMIVSLLLFAAGVGLFVWRRWLSAPPSTAADTAGKG
jgi:prolipoprotein diacylglyceryltransferase